MPTEPELDYCERLNTVYRPEPLILEPEALPLEVHQTLPQYAASVHYLYLAAVAKILQGKTCSTLPPVREMGSGSPADKSRCMDQVDPGCPDYLDRIAQPLASPGQAQHITHVLLTGATGFLGCHLLDELLRTTVCIIHLPIRAHNSEEAFRRLNAQYQRYFHVSLAAFQHRMVILVARTGDTTLGLHARYPVEDTGAIDSIIHCAASTDYLGDGPEVAQANIEVTHKLLEFAQRSGVRDFHLISCLGVLQGYSQPQEQGSAIISEDDDPATLQRPAPACFDTKLSAELLVRDYRRRGLQGSIYRTANLIAGSQTWAQGSNSSQTILSTQIRAAIAVGIVPDEFATVQLAEAGLTARAIVRLFEKKSLVNQTYHLVGPESFDLRRLLAKHGRLRSALVETGGLSRHAVAQNKTAQMLAELGFFWPPVSDAIFLRYINNLGFGG